MPTLTLFEQSCFLIEGEDYAIAVDPGSMTSPESVAALGRPDAVLVTHRHPDHADESILAQLDAPVYTVAQVAEEVLSVSKLEISRIAEGESLPIAGTPCRVSAVHADHGPAAIGPLENVGFVIETPELSLYYMGDVAVATPAPEQPFDVLLIPVGNHRYTFDPEAAAEYVRGIGCTGIVVPVHYRNSFSDAAAGEHLAELLQGFADVRVLGLAESLVLAED